MKWNSVQLNQSIKQTIFLRHLEAIYNERKVGNNFLKHGESE